MGRMNKEDFTKDELEAAAALALLKLLPPDQEIWWYLPLTWGARRKRSRCHNYEMENVQLPATGAEAAATPTPPPVVQVVAEISTPLPAKADNASTGSGEKSPTTPLEYEQFSPDSTGPNPVSHDKRKTPVVKSGIKSRTSKEELQSTLDDSVRTNESLKTEIDVKNQELRELLHTNLLLKNRAQELNSTQIPEAVPEMTPQQLLVKEAAALARQRRLMIIRKNKNHKRKSIE